MLPHCVGLWNGTFIGQLQNNFLAWYFQDGCVFKLHDLMFKCFYNNWSRLCISFNHTVTNFFRSWTSELFSVIGVSIFSVLFYLLVAREVLFYIPISCFIVLFLLIFLREIITNLLIAFISTAFTFFFVSVGNSPYFCSI